MVIKRKETVRLKPIDDMKALNIIKNGTEEDVCVLCTHYAIDSIVFYYHGHLLSSNCWRRVITFQTVDEKIVEKFAHLITWKNLFCSYDLNIDFIDKHIDKFSDRVSLQYLFHFQTLTEDFIIRHREKVNYWIIARYQSLSEWFIRRFKDEITKYNAWQNISRYQYMSADFICEHLELLDEEQLMLNEKVSKYELEEKNVWDKFKELRSIG
jgi:hypothetical protein